MADIIDAANDLTDLNIQHALANRPAPIPFTGKRKYCSETIEVGNFCDEYCREDFEKLERNKQ
ncbi:hypothetical protein [Pectobacterium odoriferum]|uniref:hypothetical protein n=1 Tax=Pectobacterium odoriferum TaxID=78398 RepID=UPI000CD213E6|nr:hypothetical protein [Pectobacterium odoriferum]POD92310.1 hypothetical protein BVY06_19515 [Pectobacterium odoriferum]POE39912.1 hypothetical protein BV920_11010 [Pectobacterium odoriferum]